MLTKLKNDNVSSFVIVCGHMEEVIKEYVHENFSGLDVTFVTNAMYQTTNTGYSLLLARPYLDGETFIKLDGDVIFDEQISKQLLAKDDSSSFVCIDTTLVNDEVIKVICNPSGLVLRIGNKLSVEQALGESIGIERISKFTSPALFHGLEKMMQTEANLLNYYEVAYDEIIQQGAQFQALDITGLKWVEMDNHEDYQDALTHFG